MTLDGDLTARLHFLVRVVLRECKHLQHTDTALFALPMTVARVAAFGDNADEAERVDAFVGRFGRLQDTLGDKLIPVYLRALGEPVGAAIDNYDRAERLGFMPSADEWLAVCKLRNQMVHAYIEEVSILVDALHSGHEFVPMLIDTATKILEDVRRRRW